MIRRLVAAGSCAMTCVASAACAEPADDAREAEIIFAMTTADQHLARSRPEHVLGKYDQMAADLFAFYRGSFPIFLHDARDAASPAAFAIEPTGPLPFGVGDAHPENFGTLLAADGTLALEPNDLDAADRWPATWDLHRLLVGLVLAARLANPDDPDARATSAMASTDVARAAAGAYAETLLAAAAVGRIDAPGDSEVLADLFERASEDALSRDELSQLTTMRGGARSLVRGNIDDAEPWSVLVDLPDFAGQALDDTLARYRTTLVDPPPPSYFRVLDAARQLGSGIASFARIRALVLVEGPTDSARDDVIVELKELAPSGAGGWFPPYFQADHEPARIVAAARAVWAEPDADPLWGSSTWLGLPVQIRSEREANKSIRVARLEDELGAPDAIIRLASVLGAELARIHGRDALGSEGAAAGIRAAIARAPDVFIDAQVIAALEGADGAAADWQRFRRALERLGPTLGIAPDDAALSPDLRGLFADPPDVRASEP